MSGFLATVFLGGQGAREKKKGGTPPSWWFRWDTGGRGGLLWVNAPRRRRVSTLSPARIEKRGWPTEQPTTIDSTVRLTTFPDTSSQSRYREILPQLNIVLPMYNLKLNRTERGEETTIRACTLDRMGTLS